MAGTEALVLLPRGAGEASLLPGDFIIVWYDDDDGWHERALLWKRADGTWEILTPDDDKYCEDYRRNGSGPSEVVRLGPTGGVPSDITESVYRFASYPMRDAHRQRLRERLLDAKAKDGDRAVLFPSVRDHLGASVSVTEMVGRDVLPRRVGGKTSHPGTPLTAPKSAPSGNVASRADKP